MNQSYNSISYEGQADAPAEGVTLITTSDTTDHVEGPFRAFIVNQDCAMKIRDFEGNDVLIPFIPKGYNSIRVKRFWTTGLTALTTITGLR